MLQKPPFTTEPATRGDAKDTKTLTVRIPLELHERIEAAAKRNDQSLNQFIADAAREAAKIALGEETQNMARQALFIDLDSFVGSPINVDAIERIASAQGRVVAKWCFSSLPQSDLESSQQALLARHFRHELLPSRDALRIRVAAEAIEINSGSEIHDFIIVTSDEELGYVASLLMRQGARVLGVGVRNAASTNPNFIRAFDSFRYYEQLASPPESKELLELRTQYAEALVQAAYNLQRREAKPVGSVLVPLIKDRHPEASPELMEFRNWRDLADFARRHDLVERIEPSGVDFLVVLSEKGLEKAKALSAEADQASGQEEEQARIRRAIAAMIGIDLPEPNVRFLIFNSVQWIFSQLPANRGISLIDLSHRIAETLASTGMQQNTTYRLLNGLFLSGAFEFEPNSANEHDPVLLKARVPGLQFDDAFVLNLMRNKRRFPLSSPINISSVVYASPDRANRVDLMLKLASDPKFDRGTLPSALAKLADMPG